MRILRWVVIGAAVGVVVAINAYGSFLIWALGVGVREDVHLAVGWWFLALNIAALVLFLWSADPKPIWRVLLFLGVVPLALLTVFVLASFWP